MSRIVDTIRREGPADTSAVSGPPPLPRGRGEPEVGAVQYFHLGDHDTVERVLDGLERLPARNLRTAISWCDWTREGGEDWYAWLLPKLIERFDVLPCFLYTPPELGMLPKTSSPPRDPAAYGEFVEMVLRRHEGDFAHVELWNEPNNYIEWDWTIDPEWVIFAEMIGGAATRAAQLGVKSVLGGMSPFDPNWLDLMFKRGALEHVDVIGVHGFPGTWEAVWEGWDAHIGRVQEVLDRHGSEARVWITESGFSTWAHDEFRQLSTMVELAEAPAERVYWYSVEDLAPDRQTLDGFHCDERAYHFGLQRRTGRPKLLARVLGDRGLDGVREMVRFGSPQPPPVGAPGCALVTGGAGSIGSALVDRLAAEGGTVTVLDNLSLPGSEENVRGLKERHGPLVRVEVGDVRDVFALRRSLVGCERVFHLAATSERDEASPTDELEVNLRGTVNLLEEARRLEEPPAIVYASTTAVYADGDGVNGDGISECHPLGFLSLHACSKGAADQYVLEYGRSFGLRTCVLRIDAADPLEADDVVEAMLRAAASPNALASRAFNVGGASVDTSRLASVTGWRAGARAQPIRPGPGHSA